MSEFSGEVPYPGPREAADFPVKTFLTVQQFLAPVS